MWRVTFKHLPPKGSVDHKCFVNKLQSELIKIIKIIKTRTTIRMLLVVELTTRTRMSAVELANVEHNRIERAFQLRGPM